MSSADIESRLKVLEDIEEIKKLKHRYCYYCDDNYDADGIANLFIEDALWDGGMRGRAEGREEIRRFFIGARQSLPLAVHMVMNPIIEVDGDFAKGTWYLFQACTFADGNRAVWGSARYDDEYVRVDGEWKCRSLNPNPPKDTDGRREDSGRGWVRELQGRWPGVLG